MTYDGDVHAARTTVVADSLGRQHDFAGQLTPIGHHRRHADSPAAPSARQRDEMFLEFGVDHGRVHFRPGAVGFRGAGFRLIGVVGGAQHRVGDLTHPRAIQSNGRIEQHQSGDPVRMGGRQMHGDRAAERMRDDDDRAVGLLLEQCGERGDIRLDRPRRVPRRFAVPDQIWCGNCDLG